MDAWTFRFRVGAFTCLAIADGTHEYDDPGETIFANAPEGERAAALAAHGLPAPWTAWTNTYVPLLIDTGAHKVLVDTGMGPASPTTGRLRANLAAAGVALTDIDLVVLTHAHPDHIGGVLDEAGAPSYPNARFLIGRDEWAFWSDEAAVAPLIADEELRDMFLGFVHANLVPLGDRLQVIEDKAEVVPGVRAIAAPGHTPGHLAIEVASAGEDLLVLGDAVQHPIHLEHPEWHAAPGIDAMPEAVVPTRRRLLARAAATGALVHGFHLDPFPHLGRVLPHGDAWRWEPVTPPAI